MKAYPVIYLKDIDDEVLEVVFFCSEKCRESFTADPNVCDLTAEGESADWIGGTVCDACCKPLESAPIGAQLTQTDVPELDQLIEGR